MEPDFTKLYSQLDLQPNCRLEELKSAYLKRIAELHPDKLDSSVASDAPTPVADLISLYTAATRFHRLHGRLPGETLHSHPRVASRPAPVPPQGHSEQARRRRSAVVLIVALLILVMVWEWPESQGPESTTQDALRTSP